MAKRKETQGGYIWALPMHRLKSLATIQLEESAATRIVTRVQLHYRMSSRRPCRSNDSATWGWDPHHIALEGAWDLFWPNHELSHSRIIRFANHPIHVLEPPIHEWYMPFTNIGHFSVFLNSISQWQINYYSRLAYASQEWGYSQEYLQSCNSGKASLVLYVSYTNHSPTPLPLTASRHNNISSTLVALNIHHFKILPITSLSWSRS